MSAQDEIKKRYPTLDRLLAAMQEDDPFLANHWTDLPVYGGPDVRHTAEVWSWDANRMIVGRCADELQIVPRSDHYT